MCTGIDHSAAIGCRKSAARSAGSVVGGIGATAGRGFERAFRPLRPNLNRRSVGRDTPEFLDFLVGDRDATQSPIFPTMKCANPPASVLNSVNHNVRTC